MLTSPSFILPFRLHLYLQFFDFFVVSFSWYSLFQNHARITDVSTILSDRVVLILICLRNTLNCTCIQLFLYPFWLFISYSISYLQPELAATVREVTNRLGATVIESTVLSEFLVSLTDHFMHSNSKLTVPTRFQVTAQTGAHPRNRTFCISLELSRLTAFMSTWENSNILMI